MSESSSKSSQPLASKQEKDGTEKRGRGRPRKQPPVSPGTALVGSQVGVKIFALVYLSLWAREVTGISAGENRNEGCRIIMQSAVCMCPLQISPPTLRTLTLSVPTEALGEKWTLKNSMLANTSRKGPCGPADQCLHCGKPSTLYF